jgi:hypothetical protein
LYSPSVTYGPNCPPLAGGIGGIAPTDHYRLRPSEPNQTCDDLPEPQSELVRPEMCRQLQHRLV